MDVKGHGVAETDLNVPRSRPSDEPSSRAVQSHGRDLVFVVSVSESKDLLSVVYVPHIDLSSLTTADHLRIRHSERLISHIGELVNFPLSSSSSSSSLSLFLPLFSFIPFPLIFAFF